MPFTKEGAYHAPDNKFSRWREKKGYKVNNDKMMWLTGIDWEDALDIIYDIRTDDPIEIIWKVTSKRWDNANQFLEYWRKEYTEVLEAGKSSKQSDTNVTNFHLQLSEISRYTDFYNDLCAELGATLRLIEEVLGYDVVRRLPWHEDKKNG